MTGVALLPSDADTKLGDGALQTWRAPTPIVLSDGEFVRPDVVDALEAPPDDSAWHPNSPRTRLLVACLQAAKDIAVAARAINAGSPWRERRPVALLATPLVTLCDHTKDLYGQLRVSRTSKAAGPMPTRRCSAMRGAGSRSTLADRYEAFGTNVPVT